MKLCKRLAIILASIMVATTASTVTMASSINSMSKQTLRVKKGEEFINRTSTTSLITKFTSSAEAENPIFYLKLDGAEWDDDVLVTASRNEDNRFIPIDESGDRAENIDDVAKYNYYSKYAGIQYDKQNTSLMKINVLFMEDPNEPVDIPLFVKVTGTNAMVSIKNVEGKSTVTESTFKFATTKTKRSENTNQTNETNQTIVVDVKPDKKMVITTGDSKSFYTEGVLPDITIEEAYPGAFKDGGKFKIQLENSDFFFAGELNYEYKDGFSGETKIVTVKVSSEDDGVLEVTIPPIEGDDIGKIILKDIQVKSKNNTPNLGNFYVSIKNYGNGEPNVVEEPVRLKVGRVIDNKPLRGVIDNLVKFEKEGLTNGKVEFVAGELKYTVNGTELKMDAQIYIQDPGQLMVPVRYTAKAFGVAESDILFSAGTATISAGDKTISLTTGSSDAVVNGAQVKLSTPVVNKDSRTFVPAGDIAQMLGIAKAWDSATKTATFENK